MPRIDAFCLKPQQPYLFFSESRPHLVREYTQALIIKGFTLLELLVVMVIIGLLAAYVGPKYFAQISKSERKTTLAQLQAFDTALDQYRLDTGHYPRTEQGLQVLVMAPQEESRWNGPYLKKAPPPDPWGNAYAYRYPGEHNEFDLMSYGKDGRPGGTDEAADISLQ